jgi:hypothetical protein
MTAFREIRGVQQRGPAELRRWFQSAFFDLFTTQDAAGDLQWFQLCYARDTWRERVLEWRRGRGVQHFRVRDASNPVRKDSGALVMDGPLPYAEVMANFEAAAAGLPPDVQAFVSDRIQEYARPARRFRPRWATTPRWLKRMRERQKAEARLRFLDSARSDR